MTAARAPPERGTAAAPWRMAPRFSNQSAYRCPPPLKDNTTNDLGAANLFLVWGFLYFHFNFSGILVSYFTVWFRRHCSRPSEPTKPERGSVIPSPLSGRDSTEDRHYRGCFS